MNKEAKQTIEALRRESDTATLACVDAEGYPQTRAMLVLEHDSLRTQYFSTNTSSGKVGFFLANPKASVYYCKPGSYQGALFIGNVEVCTDQQTKDFLWREGFERYYPKGVTDPDYCVLKFTASKGAYYGRGRCQFTMDELEETV
ncbi:MAG TPA: pyridoxamine 5'-phosphate oxidase family protein [Candidatus Limiplasma sp.]|nr:pyridoxamine 5'-phosphate oxidase family protein [Candidatus Limiplasma sp.]HRX07869.1 pyridoxamine 5'-phosphate oxidase family protein [Candidatus Limiplasma sp.]